MMHGSGLGPTGSDTIPSAPGAPAFPFPPSLPSRPGLPDGPGAPAGPWWHVQQEASATELTSGPPKSRLIPMCTSNIN
jgi:hypothetical protein